MSEFETYPQPSSVNAYSVATNGYIEFWKEMALGADANLFPQSEVSLTVFTDSPNEASQFARQLKRVRVKIVPIEPLGWPEATLLRYELINGVIPDSDADVLMHIDADMRILGPVGPELDFRNWINGIALVLHPGFYRTGKGRLRQLTMPRELGSELKHRLTGLGRFGTWERNIESAAFVKYQQRKHYVCGGVWFGRNKEFSNMVSGLAFDTRHDYDKGVIAKWHDESHLNQFSSLNQTTLLPPIYCGTIKSAKLNRYQILIEPVVKDAELINSRQKPQ